MAGLASNDKIIFVPTVHHTGTWFCLNFLYRHSQVVCVQTGDMTDLTDIELLCEGKIVLHSHMMGWRGNDLYGYGLGSCEDRKAVKWEEVLTFMKSYPTVSTIRDPLASLITRQKRHPGFSHCFIIDGFVELAKLSAFGLFLIPVDIYLKRTIQERLEILRNILKITGLPEEKYVLSWAEEWPLHNSIPGLGGWNLHECYATGDLGSIIEAIPEEYEYLKSKIRILKPFLQRLGYEDLLWWN